MKQLKLFVLLLSTMLILSTMVSAQNSPSLKYDNLSVRAEGNISLIAEAKRAAINAGLPVSIYLQGEFFADVMGVENGEPVYAFVTNLLRPEEGASLKFYSEIARRYDLSEARLNYGKGRIVNAHVGYPQIRQRDLNLDDIILVPESSNDAVMAFDKNTGDLVDPNFIPPAPDYLSTPIEAIASASGMILVSDQLDDGVVEFDTAGTYQRFFAPAGGANPDILDNVRGMGVHPVSGNLLVTTAGGANSDAIAEFDSDGNYLGNLIAPDVTTMDSPFDVLPHGGYLYVPAITTDAVVRYDLDGNFVDVFVPFINFPEQINVISDDRFTVAGFSSPSGVYVYDADGNQLDYFDAITGLRGAYELGNKNFLVTNGSGVHEINGTDGTFIRTIVEGVSARFISNPYDTPPDYIPIAEARIDANNDYVPDLLDDTVTVKGLVNSINFTATSNRFSYYVQDNTGGINITKGSEDNGGPVYNIGDEIKVTGVIGQFAGATQMNLDADMLAGIELLSTGNMVEPMEMTIADYLANAEMYEGMYIKFVGVDKAAGSDPWPDAGSSANMTITDGTETTLRVDSDTDIDENMEPEWPVNVAGVATQYTFSSPANDGYQISPNMYSDFTPYGTGVSFMVMGDWNMVSVPVMADDMSTTSLFPSASSQAFAFDNGYVTASSMMNGAGYWLKFPAEEQIDHFGMVAEGNIPLAEGWNMVGPYHEMVASADIVTDPAGIITSEFFGFDGTYTIADTGHPGHGYWVKASEAGVIVVNSVGKKSPQPVSEINRDFTKLVITDVTGKSSTLYLSQSSVSGYEMPPLPPAGAFDVRFSTNTYVEAMAGATVQMKGVQYPVTVMVDGADIRISDGSIFATLRSGENVVLADGNGLFNIESLVIPAEFELSQNYPNPFNPATTIKFGIPEASRVTLRVFNAIGEQVATLVEKNMEAGYHTVQFNASQLTSGVYFYSITAGDHNAVKKMMILK
ncbi:MAG: hypothetical protein SCALA702_14500 [Melioribacteraceae bacterium]|nr:MAG: hypothetical protein SCALA702_14500 [Melioribacteraceae bacterium]